MAPIEEPGTEEERIDIEDEAEEEEEPVKPANSPENPSPEEVECHRCGGHYPYRVWCK